MKQQRMTRGLLMAGMLVGGMTFTGCMKDKDAPSTAMTKPAAPAKVMTHYLTVDQPCYMSPGAASCGTIKKGTQVLLLIPGSMAQIETADGKTLYTKIDGIESIEVPAPAKPAIKPAPAKTVAKGTPAEPAKVMTHLLSVEQPYYTAAPTSADAKPAGVLTKGTKVLLLIPGSWCQVETAEGLTVFTKIDGVDLISGK